MTKQGLTSRLGKVNRRKFLKSTAAVAGAAAMPGLLARPLRAADPIEIVHWSWLAASDGEVWARAIDAFNKAHTDKGVQIKMELIPEEQ